MRWLCTLCFFFLAAAVLPAQTDRVEQILKEMRSNSGSDYLEMLIQLADAYYGAGQWEKSAESASQAASAADAAGERDLQAQALHYEARALLRITRRQSFHMGRAAEKLRESFLLTTEADLRLADLALLRQIALDRGRQDDLAVIDRQMRALKETGLITLREGDDFLGRKIKARELALAAVRQNQELNQQLSEVQRERLQLESQQSQLMETLQNQSAEIESMTEEQAKTQLMLAQQKNVLDSLAFMAALDSLKLEKQEMLLGQQEMELRERNAQRNFFFALAAFGLLLAVGAYVRYRETRIYNQVLEEKNVLIQTEKKRSEDLLLNILPVAIAEELKAQGAAQARQYQMATVLFTDFKDFSSISSRLSPQDLVESLDYCFKEFDAIIGRYRLEKIKTIGDAYMCAGGLPHPDPGHPLRVVQAALEMQTFLSEWKEEQVERRGFFFEARLGIHSGPIVAGVVGSKKFAYDIWGDTVNIASRMESSCEPGKVNISDTTFQLIKDQFVCLPRGKVPAKNIGEISMYYVESRK